MKISKTVKGIAVGTSLAAFAAFAVPATAHASQLLSSGTVKAKKVDDKKGDKKDDKKKKKGEGSCGGKGEGSCGGKKDEGKEK
jgi:hypothetical protein